MRKLIISTLIVLIFMVGCGKEAKAETAASKNFSGVKAAVLADLKDPYSAKFGKFEMIGGNLACIEVNAKNVYGGYVGAKPFSFIKIESKWNPLLSFDSSFESCVNMMKGWIDKRNDVEKQTN